MAKCLSVRLSVCHTPVLSLNGYTYPQSFSPSGSPTILVFPTPNGMAIFRREPPLTGASNARGYEKNHDFRPIFRLFISQMMQVIRIHIRIHILFAFHSYFGRRIGYRTQAFEWYRFA